MIKKDFLSLSILIILSLLGQLFNVIVWKRFQLGGVLTLSEGGFYWSFHIDSSRERFLIFCTFIGILVIYYSGYYLFESELRIFRTVIFFFITTMLILTRRSNVLTIFIGWEGVGLISFVLIGWFISRERAVSSSYNAFIFNRFADFFFLVLLVWELIRSRSLFYLQLPNSQPRLSALSLLIIISIWLATAGKSAQFLFHPWLTLAIEGPTPVSRLLHSSTMVVAGVYLLLKLHPIILSLGFGSLSAFIAITSRITIFFSSLWAISQTDVKKIIALSTTSQLSMMMVMICIGIYDLAFFHILLHGFFKALLFLGRGVTIHNNKSHNQNIIKSNLLPPSRRPFLAMTFLIGVLGLMGAPFMGSFASKHYLLDAFQWIGSAFIWENDLERWILLTTSSLLILIVSPILTIIYSLKLLSFIIQGPSLAYTGDFYSRDFTVLSKVVLPLGLLSIVRLVYPRVMREAASSSWSLIRTLDDMFFSTFILALFLARMVYNLHTTNKREFIFRHSYTILKKSFRGFLNLLRISFHRLVETQVLKTGIKGLLPSYDIDKWQDFLKETTYLPNSLSLIFIHNLRMIVLSSLTFIFILLWV